MVIAFTTTGSHRDATSWTQEIISLKLRKGPQDPFQENIRIILDKISDYFLRKIFRKILIIIWKSIS
jgi:hypothetical protein